MGQHQPPGDIPEGHVGALGKKGKKDRDGEGESRARGGQNRGIREHGVNLRIGIGGEVMLKSERARLPRSAQPETEHEQGEERNDYQPERK